jgi:hypothetical protein
MPLPALEPSKRIGKQRFGNSSGFENSSNHEKTNGREMADVEN